MSKNKKYPNFNKNNGISSKSYLNEFDRNEVNIRNLISFSTVVLDCKDTIANLEPYSNKKLLTDIDKNRYGSEIMQTKHILTKCSELAQNLTIKLRTSPYVDLVSSAAAFAGDCVDKIEKFENGDLTIELMKLGNDVNVSLNALLYSVTELLKLALKSNFVYQIVKMQEDYTDIILEVFDWRYESIDEIHQLDIEIDNIDIDEEYYMPTAILGSKVENIYREYSMDFLDYYNIEVRSVEHLSEEELEYLDDDGCDVDSEDVISALSFNDFDEGL